MTLRKVAARSLVLQVLAADGVTWISALAGIKSSKRDPSQNEANTETTTYDSNGNYEEVIAQRGGQMVIEGYYLLDDQTGVTDPGQQRLADLAEGVFDASVGQIRFRYPTQTQWTVWNATFSLG